jgi:predicted ATPase
VSSGFSGGAWLVELASLSDASLVTAAIATALGLHIADGAISPEVLARAIGGRELLLVIHNCEHVIDAVAEVVEALMRLCSAVSVLATSREPMRVEGEGIYRVQPLEVPTWDLTEPGREQIMQSSAIRLFLARMNAWQWGVDHRHDLAAIAAICRRLDGMPLAIEFAAARVGTFGVEQVLARLDDRFTLLTSGRRTALHKNQTLRATLDWSYELLSGPERLLLRRLAIFAAAFSLEAAHAVAGGSNVAAPEVEVGIATLIEKSLVSTDVAGALGHFRLLETTRAYALARLTESGELEEMARLQAKYYRGRLGTILGEPEMGPVRVANLGNARGALEWCFGPRGDTEIGIGLAAAFASVFHETSVIAERHRWSERAILALDDATRGGSEEMRLQASFGGTSMHMHGQTDVAHVALSRSLAIAEQRGDVPYQVEAMTLVDETIRLLDANGDIFYMPEALRVKAGIVHIMSRPETDEAEALFRQSLDLSRRQGARAWELRTAVDLAVLLAARGCPDCARALLLPVFERFEEGLEIADPRAAARLLETLEQRSG